MGQEVTSSQSHIWTSFTTSNRRKLLSILVASLILLVALLLPIKAWTREKSHQSPQKLMPVSTIKESKAVAMLIQELDRSPEDKSAKPGLDSLSRTWEEFGRDLEADGSFSNSQLGEIIVKQVQSISALIDFAIQDKAPDFEETREDLNRQLESLLGLTRMAESANDSVQTALLVVSSIACECETQRCIRMLALYDSLFCNPEEQEDQGKDFRKPHWHQWRTNIGQTAARLNRKTRHGSNRPVAIIDFAQVNGIEEIVGNLEIPSWILFDKGGQIATLIAGNSDPIDIAQAVERWLQETAKAQSDLDQKAKMLIQTKQVNEGGTENGKR